MARATETKQIPIFLLVKLFPEMQTQIPIGVMHEIQQTSWCIVDTSYVKVFWRVKRLTMEIDIPEEICYCVHYMRLM